VNNEESNEENILHYTIELKVRTWNRDEIQHQTTKPIEDKINAKLWKAGEHELRIHIWN